VIWYLFFVNVRRPSRATLFPYTTLFRSTTRRPKWSACSAATTGRTNSPSSVRARRRRSSSKTTTPRRSSEVNLAHSCSRLDATRSEEHTSELQSHLNLVCRLLLEKKKKN